MTFLEYLFVKREILFKNKNVTATATTTTSAAAPAIKITDSTTKNKKSV